MSRTPPPSGDDATLVTEDLDDNSTMVFNDERVGSGVMYCVLIENLGGSLQYNKEDIRYSLNGDWSADIAAMDEQQRQSTVADFIKSKVLPRYKESFDIWARSKDAEAEETIRAVNDQAFPLSRAPKPGLTLRNLSSTPLETQTQSQYAFTWAHSP